MTFILEIEGQLQRAPTLLFAARSYFIADAILADHHLLAFEIQGLVKSILHRLGAEVLIDTSMQFIGDIVS